MSTIRPYRIMLPALSAVALFATTAPALAQEVGGLDVQGRAPTELRIALRGLDTPAVAKAVHVAAGTVCRNAITNRDVGIGEFLECRDASAGKAMARYATIVRSRTVAAIVGAIVLSAR